MGTSASQLIASAFTFGTAALVFATLPFLFVLLRGIFKANSGNNAHSSSILSVFAMAFCVHFISCIGFMTLIKVLDALNAIYESNYLQNKVFGIFWARSESEIFSLSGASGGFEDKGLYLQLHLVQMVCDWVFLLMYWAVFVVACAYGLREARKDVMQSNTMQIFVWVLVANVVGAFIFYLWAKIASLALFIPNGDIISKIIEGYKIIIAS
ncbi:hypothetical protein [Helicobacter turcicus]|uniref:Uncharacterized protein n=1 Tax=Helicobacter turcicus TaxID=2867412 RepID=A0ABS7JPA1_9HELI|nr:hypothetical protein [Helicobacter turcicus]MBX7491249.1 hypothetical protein [Helicobacter turcicus]MBX7546112.1 hypothetical protein [Helicobacter turcicus]